MKNYIATLCIAGLCSGFMTDAVAQDNKKRNDTDYTNNRKSQDYTNKRKDKTNNEQVNTKQETPVKIIEFIPGTWTLDQVIRGGKDVSENDTVAQHQTLEFNREGRYVSYSGNERIDSGAYRLNEDHAILYMASETDEKAHEWSVWFDAEGTMTMKLHDGVAHGENFSYVYRRTSNASKR
jgi:hypothetical protein